jgi:hypothetical protein
MISTIRPKNGSVVHPIPFNKSLTVRIAERPPGINPKKDISTIICYNRATFYQGSRTVPPWGGTTPSKITDTCSLTTDHYILEGDKLSVYQPDFVALQVSVLIRSDRSRSADIQAYLESVEVKAAMQEKLAHLFQETLTGDRVPFDEIIISLDRPVERAEPVESRERSGSKPSLLARLFGKK